MGPVPVFITDITIVVYKVEAMLVIYKPIAIIINTVFSMKLRFVAP